MFKIFFILISFFFTYSTTKELGFLPGVNDLRFGYDGVKMLSTNEQRLKFPIFDLNDKSKTPFTLTVMGKKRKYATPVLTQVTNVNSRKENNRESIFSNFQDFYANYFKSNSFERGTSSPNDTSLSIEYHEILKRVYEAITKRSQTIGTSTIWWGLYSIRLAPSFILKFDPIFNASINVLISEAADPISERQQQLYNDFVQNYGTYYVSSVIVGGTAHFYSFISENYYTNSTSEEITEQISSTAKYTEFTFQMGNQSEEIYQPITRTFKNNSNTISVFQPPITGVYNQSMLQIWWNTVAEQPVVINRTLSNIANLIRSNSQVQEHLRRTIEFYLNNGFLPTLAQLNSEEKIARSLSLPRTSISPIFGLDVVGCGYDILTLQSRLCILDMSNSSENEQWTDPYDPNLSYSLPNGFFATNTPESLTIDATVMVTSVEDYYQRTTRVDVVEWRWNGFMSGKRHEKRTTEYYRRFYQDYYNLVLRLKQIGWYTLSVSVFPYPKLNSVAEKALASLPSTFDPNDIKIWEHFLTSYGTHLVVSSQMGGQIWAESWYEKCLKHEHSEAWIDEQVSLSFFRFIINDTINQNHTRDIDEDFKQNSIYSSQSLGGADSIPPEKWKEWAPTVKYNPRPISYRLVPLYELLPEGNQRSALQAAIEYITGKTELEDRKYIAQLESIRGPPPTKCSRNRVRRSVSNSTNTPISNSTNTPVTNSTKAPVTNPTNTSQNSDAIIRNALCPYVGYNGLTCAGPTGRQSFVPVYRRLPVGVGMTIDFITGNLLLPAIDFTHDNSTYWEDPLTKQQYWYPTEVSVLPVDANENQPVAHFFLNAGELENHWKYERTRGDWLGGEFGHSKSILDIHKRFFADDQAIAITQKPYVLYRLKVETLKLNVYVKNAISALPKIYNEVIYADFLRNWGTHVVLKSLVGGMHEQQVLFKDCVFSFNDAITPENLNEYLKQDILAQTLGNSFYAERRKISIDHKLGGNPSAPDVTEWQHSLGVNPALLKIEQFTPWYEIVDDPDVKVNLLRIIKNRIDTYERIRIQQETRIMNERANARILTLKSSVGFLNGDTCVITTPVILDPVANCSSGCSTELQIKSPSGPSLDRPLWYVRDPATGFVQARVRLSNGSVLNGPRVSVGCSTIPIPSMITKSASICVGCTLINSFSNACTCVCPAYPPPTTAT